MTANIHSRLFLGNVCENFTGEQGLFTSHSNLKKVYILFSIAFYFCFTYLKSVAETLQTY